MQIIVRYKLSAVSKPLLVARHYAPQRCRTSPSSAGYSSLARRRAVRVKSHRCNRIIKALRLLASSLFLAAGRQADTRREVVLARGLEEIVKSR